jgi:hypothetical protein
MNSSAQEPRSLRKSAKRHTIRREANVDQRPGEAQREWAVISCQRRLLNHSLLNTTKQKEKHRAKILLLPIEYFDSPPAFPLVYLIET